MSSLAMSHPWARFLARPSLLTSHAMATGYRGPPPPPLAAPRPDLDHGWPPFMWLGSSVHSHFVGGNDSHQSTTSQPGGAASGVEGQMQVASGSAEKAPRGKGRPAKTGPGRHGATCGICGKAFNNSSALAKHKLTHSDERKYVCPICSKAFKRQDHLNGHMMTHRSKKPFECQFEGCDKSYCDARSLRRHLENQHVHNPELGAIGHVDGEGKFYSGSNDQYFQFDAPYRQQIIANGEGRPFDPQKSPGYLAQCSPVTPTSPMHRFPYNPFDEPKPIQCSVCQRRFKNIPALNGHMRLHGGYFKRENEDEDDEDSKKSGEESSSLKLSLANSIKSENSQSSNSATASNNNNNNHQPGAGFSALKEMFKQQRQQRDDSINTNPSAQSLQQGRTGLIGGGTGSTSMSAPSQQQQPLQSPHTVNTSQSHFTFSTSVPINIIQSGTAVSNSSFSQEQQLAAALIQQQQQQQHNLPSISVAGPDMAISSNATETMVSLPISSDYNSAQQNFINVTDSSSYDNLTGYQDDAQMSHINSPMSHHSQSVPNTPSHLTANHPMTPSHHMSQPCTPNHPLTPTHPPHTPTQPNHLPHTPSYTQAHPPHTPTLPGYQAHTSVHMSGNHPMTPGPTTPSHVMTPGPHSHPNTPHPHTPSHPMTPQPHTPRHPLTPGPQTPSHPQTPPPCGHCTFNAFYFQFVLLFSGPVLL